MVAGGVTSGYVADGEYIMHGGRSLSRCIHNRASVFFFPFTKGVFCKNDNILEKWLCRSGVCVLAYAKWYTSCFRVSWADRKRYDRWKRSAVGAIFSSFAVDLGRL